jgi:hypothetical protein
MDSILARIHATLVGSVAQHPNAIVRVMPYWIEAAFWVWVAATFWIGLRWQYERITGNTTEKPKQMPGAPGFEPPTQQLPDGSMVRAEANADWTIRAWVPWTPPQPHVGPREAIVRTSRSE